MPGCDAPAAATAERSIAVRICEASVPPPVASNPTVAPVALMALTRSSMNSSELESTTCSAPRPLSSETCSGRRTTFTSGMPSFAQARTSICPSWEAAAVWTMAVWPSSLIVSIMPSTVSGLTKAEAPSAGLVSGSSSSADLYGTTRY